MTGQKDPHLDVSLIPNSAGFSESIWSPEELAESHIYQLSSAAEVPQLSPTQKALNNDFFSI